MTRERIVRSVMIHWISSFCRAVSIDWIECKMVSSVLFSAFAISNESFAVSCGDCGCCSLFCARATRRKPGATALITVMAKIKPKNFFMVGCIECFIVRCLLVMLEINTRSDFKEVRRLVWERIANERRRIARFQPQMVRHKFEPAAERE